ncbi:MAG TPA: hypothetical protein V6C89_07655 [Drouetiella sp.]|jgi:hypothetical protein
MLAGKVFTDNQVSYSVWLSQAEGQSGQLLTRETNTIARAHLRRLRKMQTQNFLQRAATEVVNLFKGQQEVA